MEGMDEAVVAGAYLRVSQDPSQETRSISGQWTDAQRVAKGLGWDLRLRYSDTGSASVFGKRRGVTRGDWDQLLSDVKQGVIQGVVLAEMSRGTRDLGAYVQLSEAAAERGVLIAAGGRVFDLRDASDFMLAALEIVFADAEARRISKRVLRGVRSSVSDGRPPQGRTPFGYHRPPKQIGERATQEPHPRNRHIWNATARYLLLGGSVSKAAQYWQKNAPVRSRGRVARWNASQVRKAMLNPAVLGLRVHKGEVVGKGTWEPITTPEIYYSVYDLLTQPGRRLISHTNSTTMLSGALKCWKCGKGMYKKTISGYLYLACQQGHSARRLEWLEGLADDLAVCCLAASLRDGAVRGLGGSDSAAAEQEMAQATQAHEEARQALKDLMSQLPGMRLNPADAAGMVSSYRAAVDDAEARVQELAKTLNRRTDEEGGKLKQVVSQFGRDAEAFVEAVLSGQIEEAAEDLWSTADLPAKRRFIRENLILETVEGKFPPKSVDSIRLEPKQGWEWVEPFLPWWRQESF